MSQDNAQQRLAEKLIRLRPSRCCHYCKHYVYVSYDLHRQICEILNPYYMEVLENKTVTYFDAHKTGSYMVCKHYEEEPDVVEACACQRNH
jgi:hypothetical protein